jgi:hypothetical protein
MHTNIGRSRSSANSGLAAIQPSDADTEDESAVAQTVARSQGFREHQRIVFRDEADPRAEPNLICTSRCVYRGREGDRRSECLLAPGICRLNRDTSTHILAQHDVLWRPNRSETSHSAVVVMVLMRS